MKIRLYLIVVALLSSALTSVRAELRLPKLISSNMVIQRDVENRIWGWSDAGSQMQVSLNGLIEKTTTNESGVWQVQLPPMPHGGPYDLEVLGIDEKIVLSNIYVGDVFFASGQSNMETTMARVEPMFPEEFENFKKSTIRYFNVPDAYDFDEVRDDLPGGEWIEITSENLRSVAAVPYFFAKKIHEQHDIPIGIINSSVGGSPIQSWLREEDLERFPEDLKEARHFKNDSAIRAVEEHDREQREKWISDLNSRDKGLSEDKEAWLNFDSEGWHLMEELDLFPQEDGRFGPGVYWFAKRIEIEGKDIEELTGKLLLGTIIDRDEVYINGHFIGSTGYRYPPRRYDVPAGVLHSGSNLILVRVISDKGKGGFVTNKPYSLKIGEQLIDLSTSWKFKVGAEMPPSPDETNIKLKPLGLYNAMVAPVHFFRISAVLWYQGESNVGKEDKYKLQFEALVNGWRKEWEMDELPFLYVQLPNYMEAKDKPHESSWASFREMQRKSLSIANTGMAITIDVGEANDIHPLDKKSVGERLALQANRLVYKKEERVFSGPLVKEVKKNDNQLLISFFEAGNELKTFNGEKLGGFSLGNETGDFFWVSAEIKGENVVIDLDGLENVSRLRYAWADNPANANLINSEGLPASPFEIEF
ncbi:sialate O-acetylesterase [Litoribacter alkaliphilus]|uniref:Sialate O-acetylesterase n=1 Tax=Litoribacter ruber TaxID=702568 RepID=A0AAP2CE82_9BACT|nr:sialate O-acetylesterase [Litoribacter alkaliphilus]MBS9522721.1 sialate O-acetylesterase [Litoribacter alkaliphilus]